MKNFLAHNDEIRKEMLEEISCASIEDLFKHIPVKMKSFDKAGLNLEQLEEAFKNGVKLFQFSNPNNPTGVIYSHDEIVEILKESMRAEK